MIRGVVLFGKRACGKDTATEIFKKLVPNSEQLRIAQFVVYACEALGMDNPTRDQLAFVGHNIGRMMIDNDIWIKMATKYADNNINKFLIVSDARYINEYEAFVSRGFIPIFVDTEIPTCIERAIKRDGHINMELFNSESETNYLKFPYDLRLDNNGDIIDLEKQIKEWLEVMLRE